MELLVLTILILINGFFALSEIALVSSKRARLEQKRQEGISGAKIALKLLDNSEGFLSAIQVGITLIGIVTGVYGGMNIADDITPFFEKISLISAYAHEIAITLTVVIITYVSIVIGELVPKTVALSNPEKIAIRVAPLIYYISAAFYPFVRLLSVSTGFINNILGIKKQSEQLTEAELRQMIRIASNEGVIERDQNVMHEKVFYFSDKKAKHLMTHRTEVEWIDLDRSQQEITAMLMKSQHSKIVCCKGGLDEIKGILILKEFYRLLALNTDFAIQNILIEPIIVPENTDAQNVLSLMRRNKTHICCVVNEYGGFEGIVTLYDIIENIVGQVPDAGDGYEPDVFVREDKSFLVNGDAPIETLGDIIPDFTIDFEEIDYATVAGFIISQTEQIPRTGDTFDYKDYRFEIMDMDRNKIDKVLIRKK